MRWTVIAQRTKTPTGWTLQVDNQKLYSSQPIGVFVRWAINVQRTLRPGG